MSANNSALANLTATYTDSENEDENAEESPRTESSTDSQTVASKSTQSTPARKSPQLPPPSNSSLQSAGKGTLRLVSYNDDTVISDDENVSPNRDMVAMEISDDEEDQSKEPETAKAEPTDKYAHYGFSLPPEPKGKVPAELMDKIKNLYEKMGTTNMDMNKLIQERKDFRNPSIYEKLIQFCEINEFGTNYPPEIYDPLQWGPESYYEELAKAQEVEMDKRKKERKKTDKVDLVAAAAKKAEDEAKKRKSKWDQPAPASTQIIKSALKGGFTSNVTGTKGTVISAFGSLPKKASNG